MTDAQRTRYYFPAWHRACESLGWRMERGRFIGLRKPVHGVADVDALYQRVWMAAEALALQAHRAITAEDLRHGCHVAALGRDKSANDLTNAELDSVVSLFKLLHEPDDLDAIIAIQHPENAERKRLVIGLRKRAPEAKLVSIARNLKAWAGEWEEPFWEDLPLAGLRVLSRIISREQKKWNQPVAASRESAGIELPY